MYFHPNEKKKQEGAKKTIRFSSSPVYVGHWPEGFFSMTAVGATNVGSIRVHLDPDLKTNTRRGKNSGVDEILFERNVPLSKGQHFGLFNLGSTIVLVFEAPENFRFAVQPGQRVLVGQPLAA
jgi:phosphatidylserine decarboxylase